MSSRPQSGKLKAFELALNQPIWAKEPRLREKLPLQSRSCAKLPVALTWETWTLPAANSSPRSLRPSSGKRAWGQAGSGHGPQRNSAMELSRLGTASSYAPMASTDGFSTATGSSKWISTSPQQHQQLSLPKLPSVADQKGALGVPGIDFNELYSLARSRASAKIQSQQRKEARSLPGVRRPPNSGARTGAGSRLSTAHSQSTVTMRLAPVSALHRSPSETDPSSPGYLEVEEVEPIPTSASPRGVMTPSGLRSEFSLLPPGILSRAPSAQGASSRAPSAYGTSSRAPSAGGAEGSDKPPSRGKARMRVQIVVDPPSRGPSKERRRSNHSSSSNDAGGTDVPATPETPEEQKSVAYWRQQTRMRRKTVISAGFPSPHRKPSKNPPSGGMTRPVQEREGPKRPIKEVLAEHMARPGSFSAEELRRMQAVFMRFRADDNNEVEKEVLHEIFSHLGYLRVTEEDVSRLADQVTPYATLDFEEFVLLAEKYAYHEFTQFKVIFDSVDLDGNGDLDSDEIMGLMTQLGITPLQKVLEEALQVVDDNCDGKINFEEFVHLMAVYRVTEGFSAAEVEELKAVFDRFALRAPAVGSQPGDVQIRSSSLTEAMLHMFGPQAMKLALKLSEQLRSMGGPMQQEQGLNFSEFLVWARILREKELEEYKRQFAEFKQEDEETVKWSDMAKVLQAYGYMPLNETLQDLQEQLDSDRNQEMDFNEFVELMATFRKNDGFTRAKAAELKSLFMAHDADHSGELYTFELLDLLRHLGHPTTVSQVRRYVSEVDFNNSGAVDFREFLRLMRLMRERELVHLKKIFESHAFNGVLTSTNLEQALKVAGRAWEESVLGPILHAAMESQAEKATFDFDAFLSLSDQCRTDTTRARLKCCSFSTEEVNKFRESFDNFDVDGHGFIDNHGLANLLRELGIPLNTRDDQRQIIQQIDVAKVKVRSLIGETEAKEILDKDPGTNFWVFVQLMRMLHDSSDLKEEKHEEKLRDCTGFMPKEVEDFRQVFDNWCRIEARLGPTLRGPPPRQKLDPHEVALKHAFRRSQLLHTAPKQSVNEGPTDISQEVLYRLLKSIGLELMQDTKRALSSRILAINQKAIASNLDIGGAGIKAPEDLSRLNFDTFLQLMRWMMDTNFVAINEVVAHGITRSKHH